MALAPLMHAPAGGTPVSQLLAGNSVVLESGPSPGREEVWEIVAEREGQFPFPLSATPWRCRCWMRFAANAGRGD